MIPVGIVAVIGVVANLVGWFFVGRAVLQLVRLAAGSGIRDKAIASKAILTSAITGALLLGISLLVPTQGKPGPGLNIPLIWVSMPYMAWFALLGGVMAVARLIQSNSAISIIGRSERLKQAGAWAIFGLVTFGFFKGNPKLSKPWWEEAEHKVEMFRGTMSVNPTKFAFLVAILVAAFFAMALLERQHRTRKATVHFFSHVTLIGGSILFGIPFAWLLVTSFKEDKDIVSAQGLTWTPYVQVQEPYMDPKRPEFEGTYEGKTVRASVITELPNGNLKLDIIKPMAIRGTTFEAPRSALKEVPKMVNVVAGTYNGTAVRGKVIEEKDDGSRVVQILGPENLKDQVFTALSKDVKDERVVGLRLANYPDALDLLPPETNRGLVFFKNTMILVIMNVLGTVLSCTVVAYAFARLRFPGKSFLFDILLATMMLPAAVTMLPTFLIWKSLGMVDTLYPLWIGSFFAGAFNVFLLQQFFKTIPIELEDAAKIDGCNYWQALVKVMVPQVKPALVAVSIFTVMGTWNNFMGPLIYINTPEKMPIAYAVQLFKSGHGGEYALMMAFSTMAIVPIIILFFFAQKYLVEGVTMSGFGGR